MTNKIEYYDSHEHIPKQEVIENRSIARLIGGYVMERKKRRLTQDDVRKIAGISQPTLARIETFDSTPGLKTFIRILDAVGLELEIVPKNKRDE